MASFGANYPCFTPDEAEHGIVIGKLVSANLTIQLATGELYADDQLAEQVSEFASGTLPMETDDMVDSVAEAVYGCKVEDGVVTYNKDDHAPMGKLGYYKTLKRNGKVFYKCYFYPKAQAALGNDNAQTRGSSVQFQTTTTTFTIYADDNGDWRDTKVVDTPAAAKAWLNEKLNILTAQAPAQASAQGEQEGE